MFFSQVLAVLALVITTLALSPPAVRALRDDQLAPITSGPQFGRRDTLPTITLGLDASYTDKPQRAPTLTGSDISLVARSQPSDGVDVYLADNVFNNLNTVIKQNCGKASDPDCQSSVAAALNPSELDIQARQLAVLAWFGIWTIGFVAAVTIHLYKIDSASNHVHLPGNDISSIISLASSSTVVFATAGGDPDKITATQVGGASVTDGAAVSTAVADGQDFHKGDLIISLPEDLAIKVHDIIAQSSQCAKKRSVSLDCIGGIANMVMRQAVPNGPLRGLVSTPVRLPSLSAADLNDQLLKINDAGKKLDGLALDDDGIAYLSELSFWITYEQIYENKPAITQFIIPASATASAPTSTSSCPPDDRQPNCSNCGNNSQEDGLCVNPWKGCPCVDGLDFGFTPFPNAQAIAAAQAVLDSLPNLLDAQVDTTPWCVNGGDPSNSGDLVRMIPVDYCQCGFNHASLYSTTTGSNGPCPYTTAPGPTIALSTWSEQTFDGQTCTFPSTTRCATFNQKDRRGGVPEPTAMPGLAKRQMMPVCFGTCPKPNPANPPAAAQTCSCVE